MHENFNRVSYSEHKRRVKKSRQFVDWVKSYARSKFRKNAAFVSKSRPESLSLSLDRGQNFAKSHPCLKEHNFISVIDRDLI